MKHFILVSEKQQSGQQTSSKTTSNGSTTIINNITNVTNTQQTSTENYKGRIIAANLLAIDPDTVGKHDLYLVYSSYSDTTGWSSNSHFYLDQSFGTLFTSSALNYTKQYAIKSGDTFKFVVSNLTGQATLNIYPSDVEGTSTGASFFNDTVESGDYTFTATQDTDYLSVTVGTQCYIGFYAPIPDGTFAQRLEDLDMNTSGELDLMLKWLPVSIPYSVTESPAIFNPLPKTVTLITTPYNQCISTSLYGEYKSGIKLADIHTFNANSENVYDLQTYTKTGAYAGQTDTRQLIVPYARYYSEGGQIIYTGGALTDTDYQRLIEGGGSSIHQMTQEEFDAGTSETGMSISPKLLTENTVTLTTTQTITGHKTFTNAKIKSNYSNPYLKFISGSTEVGSVGFNTGKPSLKVGANVFAFPYATFDVATGSHNTPVYVNENGQIVSTGKSFADYALSADLPTAMTQEDIDTGTSTTAMTISPKLFKDNLPNMSDYVTLTTEQTITGKKTFSSGSAYNIINLYSSSSSVNPYITFSSVASSSPNNLLGALGVTGTTMYNAKPVFANGRGVSDLIIGAEPQTLTGQKLFWNTDFGQLSAATMYGSSNVNSPCIAFGAQTTSGGSVEYCGYIGVTRTGANTGYPSFFASSGGTPQKIIRVDETGSSSVPVYIDSDGKTKTCSLPTADKVVCTITGQSPAYTVTQTYASETFSLITAGMTGAASMSGMRPVIRSTSFTTKEDAEYYLSSHRVEITLMAHKSGGTLIQQNAFSEADIVSIGTDTHQITISLLDGLIEPNGYESTLTIRFVEI